MNEPFGSRSEAALLRERWDLDDEPTPGARVLSALVVTTAIATLPSVTGWVALGVLGCAVGAACFAKPNLKRLSLRLGAALAMVGALLLPFLLAGDFERAMKLGLRALGAATVALTFTSRLSGTELAHALGALRAPVALVEVIEGLASQFDTLKSTAKRIMLARRLSSCEASPSITSTSATGARSAPSACASSVPESLEVNVSATVAAPRARRPSRIARSMSPVSRNGKSSAPTMPSVAPNLSESRLKSGLAKQAAPSAQPRTPNATEPVMLGSVAMAAVTTSADSTRAPGVGSSTAKRCRSVSSTARCRKRSFIGARPIARGLPRGRPGPD